MAPCLDAGLPLHLFILTSSVWKGLLVAVLDVYHLRLRHGRTPGTVLHGQNLHADIECYVAIVLCACLEPDCLALMVLLHRRWVVLLGIVRGVHDALGRTRVHVF